MYALIPELPVDKCSRILHPGWDEAVLDMRVGEQATLDITRCVWPDKRTGS